ncbi:CocE/NonD family hydrolase [Virgibacillus halodenitrificans]|uniref:CocE/NonD family hydrolase n=1 Tax=Virgibacillus halodenitrificans TaxID=1482 RepID=UPI000EF4999B|nr:CocE/NonD family hydrolase [Virgibacillus halodenitrificans]
MKKEKIIVEKNIPFELSDGTVLRSDVFRPNDNNKYPTLMLRLPYNKEEKRYYDEYLEVPRMVEAGYVVILQDVRGRFASDGEFYPFIHEGKDGYEAVEWAANLPYANGKVGLFGMSYHGYTQLAAAVENPPSLKAIAPVMTMAEPWADILNGDSAAKGVAKFQTWTLGSIIEDQLKKREQLDSTKVQKYQATMQEWLHYRPADEWPPMKDLDPNSFFFDVMHNKVSSELIERTQLLDKLHSIQIPALFIGGWFDALLEPTIAAYQAYKGPAQFWVGPWTHEDMSGHAGERYFEGGAEQIGCDEVADPTELHIKWFDHWLKDKPMAVDKPVHLYLMGQEKWAAFGQWPPVTATNELFLSSNGSSQTRRGDGELVEQPMLKDTKSELLLDPDNPVPTRGGGVLIAGNGSGVFEIGDIQDREDVLVYTSSVLREDIHILGTVKASLWVSSPSTLCDIFIRLSDVEPNGKVFNIIDTFYREKVKSVDQPFCLELEIGHTAYLLKKGHSLRVDIAASNAPLYDINLNNGRTSKTSKIGKPAIENVYHGVNFPSRIILPIEK